MGMVICLLIFLFIGYIAAKFLLTSKAPDINTGVNWKYNKRASLVSFFKNIDNTLEVLQADEKQISMFSTTSHAKILCDKQRIHIIYSTTDKLLYEWFFTEGESDFIIFDTINKKLHGITKSTVADKVIRIDNIANSFSILCGNTGLLSPIQVNSSRQIKYSHRSGANHQINILCVGEFFRITWTSTLYDLVAKWEFAYNTDIAVIKMTVEQSVYGRLRQLELH